MKKLLVITLFLSFGLSSFSQTLNGTVVYNRKVNHISIMSRLPFLTSEELDRIKLTWGNMSENKGADYLYYFSDKQALYTQKERESEGDYSWASEKYLLFRDYKKKTVKDWREMLGKKYLIEDDLPKFKWKILNEIKEVEGYLCMKAETYDPVKNQIVHAWFADGIIFSGGPEGYAGLPGLILELNINNGDIVVSATDVKLTPDKVDLPLPKKMKGKAIRIDEFDTILSTYVSESIAAERNPYWRIRI